MNNEQTDDSDIDIIVELKEPRFDWLAGLQVHLERKFGKKVEIVRKKTTIFDWCNIIYQYILSKLVIKNSKLSIALIILFFKFLQNKFQ